MSSPNSHAVGPLLPFVPVPQKHRFSKGTFPQPGFYNGESIPQLFCSHGGWGMVCCCEPHSPEAAC